MTSKLEIQDVAGSPQILRRYVTEDGAPGVHCIPLEAVATRMAMLGYDSPAPALDAIMQEVVMGEEGSGVNVYGCVYEALGADEDLTLAQVQARESLSAPLGPDGQEMSQFKDALCAHYTQDLIAAGEEFLQLHRPPTPAE